MTLKRRLDKTLTPEERELAANFTAAIQGVGKYGDTPIARILELHQKMETRSERIWKLIDAALSFIVPPVSPPKHRI